MTDGRLVVEHLDRGKLLLHLAEQLERWRQDRDLLTLDELLHPPVRVVFLTEIWQGLAGPRQVVEGSLFPGDTDLRIDPTLPTRPRRLAFRHGASSPCQDDSTSFELSIRLPSTHFSWNVSRDSRSR